MIIYNTECWDLVLWHSPLFPLVSTLTLTPIDESERVEVDTVQYSINSVFCSVSWGVVVCIQAS
jgi:hypothetical protein